MCKKVHPPGHQHGEADTASRRAFISSLISAVAFLPLASYGQEKTPVGMAEQFRQMSEEYEKEGLAAPFRGITTNSGVLPGAVRNQSQWNFRLNRCATQPSASSRR